MKKNVLMLFLLFCTAFVFAAQDEKKRIDIPRRIFEVGFDVDMGISNNYFSASELLKKNLEINLREIADEIDPNGMSFDFNFLTDFFMNLNLKNGVSVGLSSGIETSGGGSVGKNFFEFLGYGNDLNEKISVDGNADADIFSYTTTDVSFFIKDFRVSFAPTVFLPLLHAELSEFDSDFVNGSDGSIKAQVVATYRINSCIPMNPFFEKEYKELAKFGGRNVSAGFDFASTIEHQLLNTLLGRCYIRIPIVPGSMGYEASSTLSMSYGAKDIFDVIKNESENLHFDSGDVEYNRKKYWLSRPFRTGSEIAWRPFGNWMKFGALLGLGVKYPWTSEAKAYVEYKGSVEAALFNVLGINVSTAYLNEVFVHQAGFMLNCRVIELDFGVSSQGANFKKSCKGSGFGAYLGIRLGW